MRTTGLEAALADAPDMKKEWGICLWWRVDWRYNPNPWTSRADAQRFVEAAGRVCRWLAEQRMIEGE